MKVRLVFVPPGGGEADYSMDYDLPAIPRSGDYIMIRRGDEPHTEDFVVRRTWWDLNYPDDGSGHKATKDEFGAIQGICVECEFAIGTSSSQDHKNACLRYKQKTGQLHRFDNSMY